MIGGLRSQIRGRGRGIKILGCFRVELLEGEERKEKAFENGDFGLVCLDDEN